MCRRGSFDAKARTCSQNFDPSRQLVYIQLDWNDVASSDADVQKGKRRWGPLQQVLLGYVQACVRLDVDLVIESFADQYFSWEQAVGRPRHCIVQFRTSIKSIDQTADDSFWECLIDFLTRPPRLPGRPVSFQPLTCRHIARELKSLAGSKGTPCDRFFGAQDPSWTGRLQKRRQR